MELAKLRAQIDTIDEGVVDLIAKRFEITADIGIYKSRTGISSSSLQREAQQFEKLLSLAKEKQLSPALIEKIFRLIIDEVVRNHEAVKN